MTPDPHAIAQQKAALHALIDTIDSPEKLADLQAYAKGERAGNSDLPKRTPRFGSAKHLAKLLPVLDIPVEEDFKDYIPE